MDYTLLLNAIPLPDGERPASNYTLNTKLNMKVLDFVQLGGPVIARVGFQAGQDSPGVTGAKLVLEVERDLKALGGHLPHGVRGDGRLSPVVGPVGPGGGDRPRQLAVGGDRPRQLAVGVVDRLLASASSFERNHVMLSACFVCRAHVSMR